MNPLSEILSDEEYEKVLPYLDDIKIRNIIMKKEFIELRRTKSRGMAIEELMKKYNWMMFETIDKALSKTKLLKVKEL